MNRSPVLILGFLLVVGLPLGLWWLLQSDGEIEMPRNEAPLASSPAESPESELVEPASDVALTAPTRVSVEPTADPVAPGTNEPESYVKALAGVRGRVVEETGEPVAGITVTLLQAQMTDVLASEISRLFQEKDPGISIELGSASTDVEGRFLIPGADCRNLTGLGVDLEGPRASLRVLDAALHNSETTDIGDIVLAPFITFIGRVVDEAGKPIAGARIRATDLPALVFQAGVQHFKTVSRFIVDDSDKFVLEVPSWLMAYEKKLPLPTTRTDENGDFRLPGVPQGLITVVADHPNYVAATKPVPSGKGPEKQVGEVMLGTGRSLSGVVNDTSNQPLRGIEVLAGVMSPLGEVAITGAPALTDEAGRFSVAAMPEGACMFAARRGPGNQWQVIGPQEQSEGVALVLPAGFSLTVRVVDARGQLVPEVDLRVMAASSDFATTPALTFFAPPARQTAAAAGEATLKGMENGEYVVFAAAKTFGVTFQTVEIEDADQEVQLQFLNTLEITARVVDDVTNEPVHHALVSVLQFEEQQFMPFGHSLVSERTAPDGTASLGHVSRPNESHLMLSIVHPSYASKRESCNASGMHEIRLSAGGTLRGRVVSSGRPTGSIYMLVSLPERGGMMSELDFTPRFAVSDLEGGFRISNLMPGKHSCQVLKRFLNGDATGVMTKIISEQFQPEDIDEREFEIRAGETTELLIDISPEAEGPTATLRGRVTVDGKPKEDVQVHVNGSSRRQNKRGRTDATGNYEIAAIPPGTVTINFFDQSDGQYSHLNSQQVELLPADVKQIDLDISQIPVSALVMTDRGKPVEGAQVSWRLHDARDSMDVNNTDAHGLARTNVKSAGMYTVSARDQELGFASAQINVPRTGISEPVELRLAEGVPCAGRVIVENIPDSAGENFEATLYVVSTSNGDMNFWKQVHRRTGNEFDFSLSGLTEGSYQAFFYCNIGWSPGVEFELPSGGSRNLELKVKLNTNKSAQAAQVIEDGG